MADFVGTITQVQKNGNKYDLSHRGLQQALDDATQSALDAAAAAVAAEDIVTATQELIGGKKIPYFDSGTAYNIYGMVMYRREGEQSVHLYQALVNNGPGPWQDANWIQTSFYDFLVNSIQIETVRVRCQYTNTQGAIAGVTVLAVFDGVTHSYVTDSDGYVTFTVAYGTQYTVIAPNVSGYVTPKSASRVANSNMRNINFAYRLYTVGLSVIKDDGNEVDMSVWNVADNPHAVLLKLATSAGNCVFEVQNAPVANQKWASINLQFPSLPYLSSAQAAADYDGVGNTQKIEDDWAILVTTNPSLTIPATTTCRARKVTINEVEYSGFLPAAGQINAVKNNIYDINAALQTLEGNQLAITSGYWWSSSQYSQGNAWRLGNGSLTNDNKSLGLSVLPFFDF